MSELLAALARSIAGHWKRSLLVAFAVLAGLVVLAGTSSEPPADDFGVPGSESERALALFKDHTPALAGVDATVVLESRDGRLTSPTDRQAIEKTVARIGELPTVLTVSDPFTPGAPT
ncbi:MAG: MMPL family transporter, partial [Solirubrobacterales bacterium]